MNKTKKAAPPPRTTDAPGEQLFQLERDLRDAANQFASDDSEETRALLRRAACDYAGVACAVDLS